MALQIQCHDWAVWWRKKLVSQRSSYLSKSRSQRRRTSSRTLRFRCGNKDDNISIAFWDTSGDLDVDETEVDSGFLLDSSRFFGSRITDPIDSVFGSVIVMPKIFPGGNESSDFPVSFDASRSAIASSTACCRFKATCRWLKEFDLKSAGNFPTNVIFFLSASTGKFKRWQEVEPTKIIFNTQVIYRFVVYKSSCNHFVPEVFANW